MCVGPAAPGGQVATAEDRAVGGAGDPSLTLWLFNHLAGASTTLGGRSHP